ncbi:mandelate racemase/muconate lactonizing enzyme family protein [Verminephrobacter aporrectodeae subsp. tuberculatae]|nr:mandelate racemase/muconate lactonizing enzyme family protein [Verminephrobacter aporrectodeae subsp. tuberculatae]
MPMKLARIQTHILRYPDPNDLHRERMTVLARLETGDGTVGWGEAIAMWPEACRATVLLIEEGFAPLLLQAGDVTPEQCWRKMREHSWWYGEGGIACFALSAVDMALWDIQGKMEGRPLSALWGRVHERLPANASCHVNKASLSACIDEALGFFSAGFRSVKLGLGKKSLSTVGHDPESSIALVAGLRREAGGDAEILVDVGNGLRWDALTAIDTVRRMAEHRIGWIEEPFYPTHWQDYRALKRALSVPIASGEREWTVSGYQRLIDSSTVDVVGVDPARAEGITGFREIDRRVGAAGLTVNAHAWSTAITTAASLHLSLASANARLLELKPFPVAVQQELVAEPVRQMDGFTSPLNGPGLGVEVDEAVVRRLRYTA